MVLIVDKSLKKAKTLSEIFHFMGVLSTPVTPEQASRIITNRHRAVVISNPEELLWPEELIKTLKTFSLGSPVFALCRDKEAFINGNRRLSLLFDEVFSDRTFSSNFFCAIVKYQQEHSLPQAGDYRLAGINASVFRRQIHFFDTPLPFTKTEMMIVRYLIRSYPTPAKAGDILKHAFKCSKLPETANVRTHISLINKKFRQIVGKPLIFSEMRVGYRILTPEMLMYKKQLEEKQAAKA